MLEKCFPVPIFVGSQFKVGMALGFHFSKTVGIQNIFNLLPPYQESVGSIHTINFKPWPRLLRRFKQEPFLVDWLQSLKQLFINVSYHILVASLTLMMALLKTEPSELDLLQVYDMTL